MKHVVTVPIRVGLHGARRVVSIAKAMRIIANPARRAPVTVGAPVASIDRRSLIVSWCRWAIANEPNIHYAQTRPIPITRGAGRRLPLTTDCSGTVTMAFHAAGLPDPNGLGYNGQGYTGTLLTNLHRIRPAQARVGDLVVYGDGTGDHVCIILELGPDPMLFSHGQERGPIAIRLSAESRAQAGKVITYLSVGAA